MSIFIEINEAFAAVAMAAQKELRYPRDMLNVNGGAMRPRASDWRYRRAAHRDATSRAQASGRDEGNRIRCIGGGEATAIAIETMN